MKVTYNDNNGSARNMGTVSYNSGEVEALMDSYVSAKNQLESIKSKMTQEVERIRSNWSGDDAEEAAKDLDKINEQMNNIEHNVNEIISLISKLQESFGLLNYQEVCYGKIIY